MLLLLTLIGLFICNAKYKSYFEESSSFTPQWRWFDNLYLSIGERVFKSISVLAVIYGLIIINIVDISSLSTMIPFIKNIGFELVHRLSMYVFILNCVFFLSNE